MSSLSSKPEEGSAVTLEFAKRSWVLELDGNIENDFSEEHGSHVSEGVKEPLT